jgi:periplasmic copper chaperone A
VKSIRTILVAVFCAASLGMIGAPAKGVEPLVQVEDAWVRGTVEGQSGSGAYLRITSREDAQLVGASCKLAGKVEIHEMREVNNLMTMRRLESLALPAHQAVALEHERHIMLIDLKQRLVPGQSLHIDLQVRDAAGHVHTVGVDAPIRALNAVAPQHG